MVQINRKQLMCFGVMFLFSVVMQDAYAGNGGQEFDTVWNTLRDWIQGTLGRIVCGTMILVGIIAGVARQSIMAFAIGLGSGIGLYNTPPIIESVLSATVSSFTEEEILILQENLLRLSSNL